MITQDNKVKAIIFDLGNTLVKIEYKQFLINLGIDDKFNEIEIFHELEEPTVKYERGAVDSKHFYKAVNKMLSLDIGFKRFSQAWCSVATELIPGMEKIIIELNKIYPLYLLSNTNKLHYDYIVNRFPILKIMRGKFLSYEIGSIKPELLIYQHMLNNIPFKSGEIIFIDDKEINIESAEQLNINAIHFSVKGELVKMLKKKNILR